MQQLEAHLTGQREAVRSHHADPNNPWVPPELQSIICDYADVPEEVQAWMPSASMYDPFSAAVLDELWHRNAIEPLRSLRINLPVNQVLCRLFFSSLHTFKELRRLDVTLVQVARPSPPLPVPDDEGSLFPGVLADPPEDSDHVLLEQDFDTFELFKIAGTLAHIDTLRVENSIKLFTWESELVFGLAAFVDQHQATLKHFHLVSDMSEQGWEHDQPPQQLLTCCPVATHTLLLNLAACANTIRLTRWGAGLASYDAFNNLYFAQLRGLVIKECPTLLLCPDAKHMPRLEFYGADVLRWYQGQFALDTMADSDTNAVLLSLPSTLTHLWLGEVLRTRIHAPSLVELRTPGVSLSAHGLRDVSTSLPQLERVFWHDALPRLTPPHTDASESWSLTCATVQFLQAIPHLYHLDVSVEHWDSFDASSWHEFRQYYTALWNPSLRVLRQTIVCAVPVFQPPHGSATHCSYRRFSTAQVLDEETISEAWAQQHWPGEFGALDLDQVLGFAHSLADHKELLDERAACEWFLQRQASSRVMLHSPVHVWESDNEDNVPVSSSFDMMREHGAEEECDEDDDEEEASEEDASEEECDEDDDEGEEEEEVAQIARVKPVTYAGSTRCHNALNEVHTGRTWYDPDADDCEPSSKRRRTRDTDRTEFAPALRATLAIEAY